MTRTLVIDFDDTLVRTGCRVFVQRGAVRLSLSTEAFAAFVPQAGDQLDFSDFEKVRGARPIRPTLNLLRRAIRLGMEVIVLTARGNREAVARFLRRYDLDPMIVALGNGSPQCKWSVVDQVILDGARKVLFLDDSARNCAAVGALVGAYKGVEVKVKQYR